MYCQKCGEKIEKGAKFCANCGAKCSNEKSKTSAKETQNTSENNIKKKLLTLCIIGGIGCLLLCGAGFMQVHSVKQTVSYYEEDVWEKLNSMGCNARLGEGKCYCTKADDVDDCVEEYLANPPEGFDNQFYVLAKNRYTFLIVSICFFIASWVFYKKNKNNN